MGKGLFSEHKTRKKVNKIKVLLLGRTLRGQGGLLCAISPAGMGKAPLSSILTIFLLHGNGREENWSQEYKSIICLVASGAV